MIRHIYNAHVYLSTPGIAAMGWIDIKYKEMHKTKQKEMRTQATSVKV